MSWEIIDDNGVLFSGKEHEMIHAFDVMTDPMQYSSEDNDNYPSQWEGDLKLIQVHTQWEGDLKLIQVHNISR